MSAMPQRRHFCGAVIGAICAARVARADEATPTPRAWPVGQETPDWIKDTNHPIAAPVNRGLFGSWEGNWVAWNTGHDVTLPGSTSKGTMPFLMYPNAENASGRFDELAPDNFRYAISAREITP
jgi:hypothetical protein